MLDTFRKTKRNLTDNAINKNFFKSLNYVFAGLIFTGMGVWVASALQIMFISFFTQLFITLMLLGLTHYFCYIKSDKNATLAFYLFSFWMGMSLYEALFVFSLILTPQVVIFTVGMTLLTSALLIFSSLVIFSVSSHAAVARENWSSIIGYGAFILVTLIIFGLFVNPANISTFLLVDGLISTGLFSVFLILDTFKAAYMGESKHAHPIINAMTIYLDILNLLMATLKIMSALKVKNDQGNSSLTSALYEVFVSVFGVLMPIMLGVYLICEALFGAKEADSSISSTSSENLPVARASTDFSNPPSKEVPVATDVQQVESGHRNVYSNWGWGFGE